MRTALLTAVSHDLRTPLAAADAAVESLRGPDVTMFRTESGRAPRRRDRLPATARPFVATCSTSVASGRRTRYHTQPIALDEVIPLALDALGAGADNVQLQIPDEVPDVLADPTLLERVLLDLIANALRHTPPGRSVLIAASADGDTVEVRVIDRGPEYPTTNAISSSNPSSGSATPTTAAGSDSDKPCRWA